MNETNASAGGPTPGPLRVLEPIDPTTDPYVIVDADDREVARIGVPGRPNGANARLYAASPGLLAACDQALLVLPHYCTGDPAVDPAYRAWVVISRAVLAARYP